MVTWPTQGRVTPALPTAVVAFWPLTACLSLRSQRGCHYLPCFPGPWTPSLGEACQSAEPPSGALCELRAVTQFPNGLPVVRSGGRSILPPPEHQVSLAASQLRPVQACALQSGPVGTSALSRVTCPAPGLHRGLPEPGPWAPCPRRTQPHCNGCVASVRDTCQPLSRSTAQGQWVLSTVCVTRARQNAPAGHGCVCGMG